MKRELSVYPGITESLVLVSLQSTGISPPLLPLSIPSSLSSPSPPFFTLIFYLFLCSCLFINTWAPYRVRREAEQWKKKKKPLRSHRNCIRSSSYLFLLSPLTLLLLSTLFLSPLSLPLFSCFLRRILEPFDC